MDPINLGHRAVVPFDGERQHRERIPFSPDRSQTKSHPILCDRWGELDLHVLRRRS